MTLQHILWSKPTQLHSKQRADLWHSPRCTACKRNLLVRRCQYLRKTYSLTDGFKCCEVHWLYSRCDNPKQHIRDSVSISHIKDTICSVSGTVTAESTELLTGPKSKWVLLKYFLTSSSKFTSFYLHNC